MHRWKSAGIVVEGDPIDVGGFDPWKFQWHSMPEEPIELPHPAYPNQRHRMWIYEIHSAGRKVRFAAGELSANVWGFYVPDE